jgi:quinol monooxygenase YgiN
MSITLIVTFTLKDGKTADDAAATWKYIDEKLHPGVANEEKTLEYTISKTHDAKSLIFIERYDGLEGRCAESQ